MRKTAYTLGVIKVKGSKWTPRHVFVEKSKPVAVAGKLVFPGGTVEQDDHSIVESLCREIREELKVVTEASDWSFVACTDFGSYELHFYELGFDVDEDVLPSATDTGERIVVRDVLAYKVDELCKMVVRQVIDKRESAE